jgi:hypothetical protein
MRSRRRTALAKRELLATPPLDILLAPDRPRGKSSEGLGEVGTSGVARSCSFGHPQNHGDLRQANKGAGHAAESNSQAGGLPLAH